MATIKEILNNKPSKLYNIVYKSPRYTVNSICDFLEGELTATFHNCNIVECLEGCVTLSTFFGELAELDSTFFNIQKY